MLQKRLVISGLLLSALALSGCNRDTAGAREEFAGVMTTEDGTALLPVTLPQRKGDTILGAAAAADQPIVQESGAPEVPQIDDSSAQAVGDSIVQMAAANDWQPLLDLLVDEQADALEPLMPDLTSFMSAVGQVNRAAGEKAGVQAMVLRMDREWLESLAAMATELTVAVEPDGDEAAFLVFAPRSADAADAPQVELTARRVEDRWRLELPGLRAPVDPAELELQQKADNLQNLADRIRNDELTDAEAILAQAEQVAAGTYEADSGSDQASADQDQPRAAEPTRQTRQRDQVDEVYSGPGMLRGR